MLNDAAVDDWSVADGDNENWSLLLWVKHYCFHLMWSTHHFYHMYEEEEWALNKRQHVMVKAITGIVEHWFSCTVTFAQNVSYVGFPSMHLLTRSCATYPFDLLNGICWCLEERQRILFLVWIGIVLQCNSQS